MASAELTSTPTASPRPAADWAVTAGLAWIAAMLALLGCWIYLKDIPPLRPVALGLFAAGGAALALGIWEFVSRTDHGQAAARRHRILGMVGFGASLLLAALGVYLVIERKADAAWGLAFVPGNFAEAGALVLFALYLLRASWVLFRGPQDDLDTSLQSWRRTLGWARFVIMALVLVGLGVLVYLTMTQRVSMDYAPEFVGLVLACVVGFSSGMWLLTQKLGQASNRELRVFALLFGGSLGLILFLVTLGRAWLWSNDIFFSGISAWQGDQSYKVWLVIYLQVLALGILSLSSSMARADIRSDAVLRRILFGYNTLLVGLLLLQALILVNIATYLLMPFNYEWNRSRGIYALAPSTKNLLSKLGKETHIYVLLSDRDESLPDTRSLLDNFKANASQKLQVDYISPDVDSVKYQKLANQFPKILPDARQAAFEENPGGRGILIVYGALPADAKAAVPHSFIPARKLAEVERAKSANSKGRFVYKGEVEITRELAFLMQNQQKKRVYFLQGEGQPDINDRNLSTRRDTNGDFSQVGIGDLVDRIRKENYEIQGLRYGRAVDKAENTAYAPENADKKKDVPEDAYAIVVIGSQAPLSPEVVESIDRYLERGGRMMVFLDVIADASWTKLEETGLEPLLRRYGVEVKPAYPLRLITSSQDDARSRLLASSPDKSENLLAKQFAGQIIFLDKTTRLFEPVTPAGRFRADPILDLDTRRALVGPGGRRHADYYLLETRAGILRNTTDHIKELLDKGEEEVVKRLVREPLPVAVAVSEKDTEKPRLVVFGDTDGITNLELRRSMSGDTTINLVISSLEWLADKEGAGMIGVRPKESSSYSLKAGVPVSTMVQTPGWIMLFSLAGFGTAIWLVRRR